MTSISPKLRHEVEARAKGYCEYCQTHRLNVISMQIDHIIPRAAGGKTELDNLCLTCSGCNSFKLDFQTGIDPETNEETPLFHPRQQNWHEHFAWDTSRTQVIGLTPVGRATISRLKMNRPAVVMTRERWVAVGWHPPKEN